MSNLGIVSQNELCQDLRCCGWLQEWRSEDWAKADNFFPSVHLTSPPRLQASCLPHITLSVIGMQPYLSKAKWQGTPFAYFPFLPVSSNLCQVVQEVSPKLKDRSKMSQKITSVVQSLKSSSHVPEAHLAITVYILGWQSVRFVFSIQTPCMWGSGIFSFLKLRPFIWTLKIG